VSSHLLEQKKWKSQAKGKEELSFSWVSLLSTTNCKNNNLNIDGEISVETQAGFNIILKKAYYYLA